MPTSLTRLLMLALGLACLAGCPAKPPAVPTTPATPHDHGDADHDDEHERNGMLIEHFGPKHHAGLTASFSPAGPQLELFLETLGNPPTPAPLPLAVIKGRVTGPDGKDEREVEFRPAPAGDRPAGEGDSKCSHYVAAAPWLKPDGAISLTIRGEVGGRERKATWTGFEPGKHVRPAAR